MQSRIHIQMGYFPNSYLKWQLQIRGTHWYYSIWNGLKYSLCQLKLQLNVTQQGPGLLSSSLCSNNIFSLGPNNLNNSFSLINICQAFDILLRSVICCMVMFEPCMCQTTYQRHTYIIFVEYHIDCSSVWPSSFMCSCCVLS